MFGRLTYMVWLGLFIGLPLLFLWLRWGRSIWRRRRGLAWVVVGSLVGGWMWDLATVRVGVWYYDDANLVGWWLLGLPIEEWLWVTGVTLLFGSTTVVFAERAGLEAAAPSGGEDMMGAMEERP